MSIKNDKSMDFSVIAAMDKELIDGMLSMEDETGEEIEYTDEQRWYLVDESMSEEDITSYGFTKEKYNEGEYYGYKYTKKISNIDDISGTISDFTLEEFQNISESIVFIKDGDKYKANFVMSSEEQSEETEGYNIGIEMKFVVTLPNEAISNNATKVSDDGKTLTWNLLDSTSQNISFEFSFKDNTLLYVGIILGIIVLVSVIAIVFIYKNNKKGTTTNIIDEPVTPVQPIIEEPHVAPTQDIVDDNINNQ